MTSPTQLSTKHLEAGGFVVQTVERRIHGNRLRDFLGCIDLIGLHPNGTVIAVQTTTAANVASRITKVRESEHLDLMRGCGWVIRCHGWAFRADVWQLVRDEDLS